MLLSALIIIGLPLQNTLPLIAILLVFQMISSLIVGLTSIATNLLATVFLISSVAGWIANAPSGLIFQTAGIGIFFAFAPHIAGWLLKKVTDLTLVLPDFLLPDVSGLLARFVPTLSRILF